ncbi:MAG: HEAT repeat domain-containing protein [Myxococcales bacterium]|nr:HEAT repeat domain-containing protein [Myxococcales bacterium]
MGLDATHRSPTSPGNDPLIGTHLGNFRIEERIAEGGMGLIYRAVHKVIGRQAAIKVLTERYSSDRNMIKRLHREAQAVNRIGHPNIIDIFDFGQTPDNREYFVMEYLPGDSLAEILAREQRLPWSKTEQLMTQLLDALAAAHDLGIIHRDIKPENILIVPQSDGTMLVKVLDFGIAKSVGLGPEGEKLTRAGSVMGTPEYIAPEQIRGKTVDGRADIYAAGVILFECVAGRRPYDADKVINLLMMHLRDPIPEISEIPPELEVPGSVQDVIRKAMAKKPDERYADARDFAQALGLPISEVRSTDGTRELPDAFWEAQSGGTGTDPGAGGGVFTAPRATLPGATGSHASHGGTVEMRESRPASKPSALRWLLPLALLVISGSVIAYAVIKRKGGGADGSGTGSGSGSANLAVGTGSGSAKPTTTAGFAPVKDMHRLLTLVRKVLRRNSDAGDIAVRQTAVRGIGELRDADARALLMNILKEDPNPAVRATAARALADLGDSSLVDTLRKARKVSAPLVQVSIDHALVRLGQRAARGRLRVFLRDKDKDVRKSAASVLGKLGDKRVLPVLLQQIRAETAQRDMVTLLATAARLGHGASRKSLEDGLARASKPKFQLECADALARLGDEKALAALEKMLRDKRRPLALRLSAAGALAALGNYAGVEDLKRAIRMKSATMRVLAASGLGAIADRAALPPLAEALSDKRARVQAAAAEALARVLAQMPNQLLRRSQNWAFAALESGSLAMRHAAVGVSGEMDPQLAIELLGWALKDSDARVRAAAVASIGRLKRKNPRAIKILTVALADKSPEVRASAARALGAVKAPAVTKALKTATRDPDSLVGIAAAGSMLARGDTSLAPHLARAVHKLRKPRLRAAAYTAIGNWRSKRALALLRRGLKDRSSDVRYAAAMALAHRGDKAGLGELRRAVREGRDDGGALRVMAALGVSQRDQLRTLSRSKKARDRRNAMVTATDLLQSKAAIGLLARGARDSSVRVRRAAARGLTRMVTKSERAARLLRTLSHDPDPAVRAIALIGLAKRKPKNVVETPAVEPVKKAPLPENVTQPQRPPPKPGKKEQLFLIEDSQVLRRFKHYHELAEIAKRNGRTERAVNWLKKAARLTKKKAQAWCEIGKILIDKAARLRGDGIASYKGYRNRARDAFLRCRRYRPDGRQRALVRAGLRDVKRLR